MGRKNRNAEASRNPTRRERSFGVHSRLSRPPKIALDTENLQPWQHALLLGASLWCRDRYSVSCGVTSDPYGVWHACRFPVMASGVRISPGFGADAVWIVHSHLRSLATRHGVRQGFSEQMLQQVGREQVFVPTMLCYIWRNIGLLVGSLADISADMLRYLGVVRAVWMPPRSVVHEVAQRFHESFILTEPQINVDADMCAVPVVKMDASQHPHLFAATAANRHCAAVIAHSPDALVLGWCSSDRCYQVVTDETSPADRLLHPSFQLSADKDLCVRFPPERCFG